MRWYSCVASVKSAMSKKYKLCVYKTEVSSLSVGKKTEKMEIVYQSVSEHKVGVQPQFVNLF